MKSENSLKKGPDDRLIVLVSGKKRSGKDYFARLLNEALNREFMNNPSYNKMSSQKLQFADPIKEILQVTLGLTETELDNLKNSDTIIEPFGKTMRQIIQHFGTNQMQSEFGKDVWVKQTLKRQVANVVIISDYRFLHESISDFTIRISGGDSSDDHISENELNDITMKYNINNDERGDLTEDVSYIVKEILKLL